MVKVEIPFQPKFKQRMLDGVKIWTARNKRYGDIGDGFTIFGADFEIVGILRMKLGDVATFHFREEGFKSKIGFVNCWCDLHPRRGYVPSQKVWVHAFEFVDEAAPQEKQPPSNPEPDPEPRPRQCPQLVSDGLVEQPAEDFHTFPRRVKRDGGKKQKTIGLSVSIPAAIRHLLELQRGDLLQVAIRRMTEAESLKLFGTTGKQQAKRVLCPICGHIGSLGYHARGTTVEMLSVTHYQKRDGFPKDKAWQRHYIPKKPPQFHAFYDRFRTDASKEVIQEREARNDG